MVHIRRGAVRAVLNELLERAGAVSWEFPGSLMIVGASSSAASLTTSNFLRWMIGLRNDVGTVAGYKAMDVWIQNTNKGEEAQKNRKTT